MMSLDLAVQFTAPEFQSNFSQFKRSKALPLALALPLTLASAPGLSTFKALGFCLGSACGYLLQLWDVFWFLL